MPLGLKRCKVECDPAGAGCIHRNVGKALYDGSIPFKVLGSFLDNLHNSRLVKRIIPCLDVKNGRVVKGVKFKNLRNSGDPVEHLEVSDGSPRDQGA